MFDIGWSEMLIIAVVLVVVVGPKDLPKVLRMAGRWAAKARQMASEFQNSLQDMAREAELDDVQREIKKITDTDVKTILKDTIDPSGDMAKDMQVELPDLNPDRVLKQQDSAPSDDASGPKQIPEPELKPEPEPESGDSAKDAPEPAGEPDKPREA